jgi:hypothetical protein
MKRSVLFVGALVLSMPLAGCDSSGSSGTPGKAVLRSEDSHLPKEVREYEAKKEQQFADRAAKAAAKASKAASKGR